MLFHRIEIAPLEKFCVRPRCLLGRLEAVTQGDNTVVDAGVLAVRGEEAGADELELLARLCVGQSEAVTDNSDYAYLQLNTANSRIKPCHRYYPIPDTEVTYSKNNLDNNEYKAYGL